MTNTKIKPKANHRSADPLDSLGSPSGYASFWGKLRRKWDWWIYCRAVHSLRRMTLDNPGMAYLMELQIREWNEKLAISPELRHATERFYEAMQNHRHNAELCDQRREKTHDEH